MAQKDYTTTKRKFQYLTSEKRAQIEIMLKMKTPKKQIAREVGISRSTLYNEIERGIVEQITDFSPSSVIRQRKGAC